MKNLSSDTKKKSRKKSAEQKAGRAAKEVKEEAVKVERAIKSEVRKAEGRESKAAPARPAGKVPQATVVSRHGTGMVSRKGRGFSLAELSGAGIEPRSAMRWGAKIDPRRRSVIDGNVSSLKAWGSHSGTSASVRKDARAAEVRVEEVAHELKVDAEVVEREAVKAERAVKREAKKAETAVEKKVERKPRKKKSPDSGA